MSRYSKSAFAAFLFLAISVPGEAQDKKANRGGTANQEKQRPERPPLLVRIVEDKDAADRRRTSEQTATQDRKQQADAQRQSIQASWAQAIFGFVSILLLVWTLWYARKSAAAAHTSAESARTALQHTVDAAVAATRSADAAERAIEQAALQFSVSSRPWIVIDPRIMRGENITVSDGRGDERLENGLIFTSDIRNIGQLPARDMQVRAARLINQPTGEPNWPAINWETGPTGSTIAPSQLINTDLIPVFEQEVRAVYRGAIRILFRVAARYVDPGTTAVCETIAFWELFIASDFDQIVQGNMSGVQIRSIGTTMT